jgi:DNA polymerase I-like protein with 3'-5' exonuclease and polymerase domains
MGMCQTVSIGGSPLIAKDPSSASLSLPPALARRTTTIGVTRGVAPLPSPPLSPNPAAAGGLGWKGTSYPALKTVLKLTALLSALLLPRGNSLLVRAAGASAASAVSTAASGGALFHVGAAHRRRQLLLSGGGGGGSALCFALPLPPGAPGPRSSRPFHASRQATSTLQEVARVGDAPPTARSQAGSRAPPLLKKGPGVTLAKGGESVGSNDPITGPNPNLLRCPGLEGVHVVDTVEGAREALQLLMRNKDAWFAVDTEVADIDVKTQGPVENGRVICVSIYAGPDVDIGGGQGKALWVDNMDAAQDVLLEIKPFLESEEHRKVWHNYGFDRHVLYNAWEGDERRRINCKGFAGDTMHMARLWDTSLSKTSNNGGFSLEALSQLLLGPDHRKRPMKEIFGEPKLRKDGTPGNMFIVAPVDELQRDLKFRTDWIRYSAYDAQATWLVRQAIEVYLRRMQWQNKEAGRSMWDFYQLYYVPFGELLTDMERAGIYVNAADYLAGVEKQARADQVEAIATFKNWVQRMQPEADEINPASTAQIQALLFGGARNERTGEEMPTERAFKVERDPEEVAASEAAARDAVGGEFHGMTAAQLKDECRSRGLKLSGTKAVLLARLMGGGEDEKACAPASGVGEHFKGMKIADLRDTCASRGLSSEGTKKQLEMRLKEDAIFQLQLQNGGVDQEVQRTSTEIAEAVTSPPPPKPLGRYKDMVIRSVGMKPIKTTATGWPAVSMDVLRKLAGKIDEDPPMYGPAFEHFGGGQDGVDACKALDALCKMGSIDTMLSNFLLPLQTLVDKRSRVHCSLNLNTETGRLSARRPNLQNQPALEKDQYKIRSAFAAEEGNMLVVADYGQLELRLLAEMTECESMLDAFEQGGCFHSRTAVGMFDHVRKAVDDGDVLLEWDYSKGKPPKDLVKDAFASERRKAKTLNFSIAYGKTPHGLSKDWGVSVKEAEELLRAWYADRPEVLRWQKMVIERAKEKGYTKTLMGRYRILPDINSRDRSRRGHMERAAINTPIQGGAADVAMMAMIKLVRSETLKRLGWKLLLQVCRRKPRGAIILAPTACALQARPRLDEDTKAPDFLKSNAYNFRTIDSERLAG